MMRERGFPIDYDTGFHRWGIRQSPHRFSVEIEGEITHIKLTLEQAEHYLYQAINQGAEDSHIIEEPLPNWPKP